MKEKSILCYGDSNTWGYIPSPVEQSFSKSRFTREQRWTGMLQKILGDGYYVIEEGLNSRTTNIDYDENGVLFMKGAMRKFEKLIGLSAELAKEKKCHYLDTARDLQLSVIDGVHLDLQGHTKFAHLLVEKIKKIRLCQ